MCNRANRICFITTLPITLELFVYPQAEHLIRQGWEVTFISAERAEFNKNSIVGVKYIELPFKRGIDIFGIPRAILKLYQIFRREHFDIVQYSTPNAAFYASTAAWMARVPVRLYAQWGIRYVGFTGFTRAFLKQFEHWCCYCSTIIEPDSFSNLDFSIKEGLYPRNKGRVIWNGSAIGVDLDRFNISRKDAWRIRYRKRIGCDARHLIVGFVGSIRRDKGCNELISASRSIFDDMPKARLLLIGDKDFYDTIDKDLRYWVESSEQVIYIPPNSQIERFMACMDIFALPSYREGFGLVIAEAEAMGVPVVTSDVPGPIDAVRHEKTGLVVQVKNVDALAMALQYLLKDSNKRADYSAAAAAFARESFEQIELLRRILEDKNQLIAESCCLSGGKG